jgi:hypothetical protein
MAKPRGYRKSARTWHKACPESILVLNLQKSQWGDPQLYINLGVYMRDLGPEVTPPEYRCHIRARLERVCPPEYFSPVRSASSVDEPSAALLEAIERFGLPWLESLSVRGGIQEFLSSPLSRKLAVMGTVWPWAGMQAGGEEGGGRLPPPAFPPPDDGSVG